MKTLHILTVSTALLVAGTAIAKDDISHNWVSEAESKVIKVFADKYEQLGGIWKETTFGERDESVTAAKSRFLGGNPPAAVQQIIGGETIEWEQNGMTANLNGIAKADNWEQIFSPAVLNQVKTGDNYSSIPVFIEVINFLYANHDVLKDAGVDSIPTTWDDFVASLDKVKASGKIPLALGGDGWQLGLVYDNVLLSVGGGDLYSGIIYGNQDIISSAETLEVFNRLAHIRDNYLDAGQPNRSFPDTLSLVVSGKAAYNFMGGWGAGFFKDKEASSWSCTITPWASTSLTILDGFLFVKGGDVTVQNRFAKALVDPETQMKAATLKGTIPAIANVDTSTFSGCSKVAAQSLESNATAGHWNGELTDNKNALKDALVAFFEKKLTPEQGQQDLLKRMKNL